jgi:hypothetical protein
MIVSHEFKSTNTTLAFPKIYTEGPVLFTVEIPHIFHYPPAKDKR